MKKSYVIPKTEKTNLSPLNLCQAQQYIPFTLTGQGDLFDECGGGLNGDVWLLQNIVAGANITVSTTPVGSNIDIILRILNPDNSEVVGCTDTTSVNPSGESFGPFVATQSGEYEIHVHNDFTGGFGNQQPYSIVINGTNDGTPTLILAFGAGDGSCGFSCPAGNFN